MADYTVQDPAGNEHVITGPDGASDTEILQAAQNLLTPGMLESAGRGALNNLPLGGQIGALGTMALNPDKDYSTALSDVNQQAAAAKAAHPIAYGAGAVAGSVAPLAIPGVGEAFAAAPATAGAALGAANAVGNIDVTKQPQEALKQGLEGAATGAILGKVLPTGAKTAEGLEGFANKKAVQSLGLKAGVLGIPSEELEDLGKFASETGLTQGPLEQRVGQAQDLLQQTGAQIGEHGAGASPLTDVEPYIQRLHDLAQESASIYDPAANAEAGIYRQALANLQQPNLTFDTLQQLKTGVGQRAFDASGEVRNDALANVYGVYKDAMKSIIEGSPTEYQDAMTTYGKLKDIHGALMNQWQKEQAQGLQAKGFGLAGKMGGMITGGNVPATLGLAGAIAPAHPFMGLGLGTTIITNPQAMESAARGLGQAVPKAAAGLKMAGVDALVSHFISNPQTYGKYAQPLLQAMQTGGKQGFAATSFVLRQQHPELNEIMLKQGTSDESQ